MLSSKRQKDVESQSFLALAFILFWIGESASEEF
jgi:hypothetical protein